MKASLLFVAIIALWVQTGQASVDGMISYWRLDEPTGDIVLDSVGNNHGTIDNDPQRITGIVGGAVSFDGVWDGFWPRDCVRIDSPSDIPIGNSPWSLSMWIKIDNYPSHLTCYRGLIFDRGNSTGIQKGMHRLAVGWEQGGTNLWNCFWGTAWDYDTGITIDLETWYHITNTYDGSTARIYINGVEHWSQSIGSLDVRSSDIWLGGAACHLSAGTIDEVAIYDRPLAPEEIWRNYENGLNGIGYPIKVEIDIKPGSDLNAINPDSQGVIPVAILTTEDFDASTVDPDSIMIAGRGVAVRGKGSKSMARLEDVDGDGDIDLLVQVNTYVADHPWDSGPVDLTGETFDGTPIAGRDYVLVVPN